MLRFVTIFVLIAVCIAALGLYRGWFRVTADRGGEKPNITITVDKDKIHDDQQRAQESVGAGKSDSAKVPAPATSPN